MKAPTGFDLDQNCGKREEPAMPNAFGTFAQTAHPLMRGFDQLFISRKTFLVKDGFQVIEMKFDGRIVA